MYDMQITSHDANLSFFFIIIFYGWIYNLHNYSTYRVIINAFFALNLKIYKILQFTIRSYDLQSHLPSTILCRIPILTTPKALAENPNSQILHAFRLCTRNSVKGYVVKDISMDPSICLDKCLPTKKRGGNLC